MPIDKIQDALVDWLSAEISPVPKSLGAVRPEAVADLPAVVLAFSKVSVASPGVGRRVAQSKTGALRVAADVALANPVLSFPGEADVNLLSADRRTLKLPHAPLVDHLGGAAALANIDMVVKLGAATYQMAAAAPVGNQFAVDREAGELTFGVALPANGTLHVEYFIGEWEEETSLVSGSLEIEVYERGASKLEDFSRAVMQALRRPKIPGLLHLSPTAVSFIDNSSQPKGSTRFRVLTYDFRFEVTDEIIPSGGGKIRIIPIRSQLAGPVGVEDTVVP